MGRVIQQVIQDEVSSSLHHLHCLSLSTVRTFLVMDLATLEQDQPLVDLTTMGMDMSMDLGQTLMVLTSVALTIMDMSMDLGQTLMVLTSVALTIMVMDMSMDLGQTLMVLTSV